MNTNPSLINRYQMQERLGQSSIAEVWKALDTHTHRNVAIKIFHVNLQADPEFVTRFQREVQVIASLRHPNIVQYYDSSISQTPGAASATAYIVMDYVEGGTLASYIRNTSREGKLLPLVDIVRLFTSIGMAIDYAHQRGVVHGDLKPANILLDKRNISHSLLGEPIVTDFGMAKLLGAAAASTSGSLNATPLYISPEQAMGSPATASSDLYSLGIMLYEICTGTPPFLGSNPAAIMNQHVNTIPASPALINPTLPPALITVIMRSIAKDPSLRFPSASALVAALATASQQEALRKPIPESIAQTASPANAMDMPTMMSTKQTPLLSGMASSGPMPSSPGISGTSFPSPLPPSSISGSAGQSPPYYSMSPVQGPVGAPSPQRSAVDMSQSSSSQPYQPVQPGGPITPLPPSYTPAYSSSNYPAGVIMQPPPAPPPQKRRQRGLLIALAILLILALIGSGLGAYFAFFSKSTTPVTPTIVGHAYFASSGLLSPDSKQGITDQLQINLGNIPPPQSGKSYYAWLLNDTKLEFKAIFMGQLTVNQGKAVLFFPGDALHSNLLATNSRFLITEEDATATPTNPSLDPNAWIYYAEFSQRPDPADPNHYSLYDHIRHLLAEDPKVKAAGLTGGLDIWLYRNTQKILEWAGSARDFWKNNNPENSAIMHRQLIRIIDYLDGVNYAQQDLPGQSLLVDPIIARVPLLTFDPQNQNPPGYLYHVGKHLKQITLLPQTSADQKALADQINQDVNRVNSWFETIRNDVLQLNHMTDTQLFSNSGLTLLDSVATLANYAFVGQVNPHAQVAGGVVQIHYNIQRLATFDIRACTTSDPCTL